MASTPTSPETDSASVAAPVEAGLIEPLPDLPMVRAVIVAAAHGPSSRPVAVLLIAVAAEAVFIVARGAVQQTRHILGMPRSLMALTAVVAGAMGGLIVGSVVVLVGAVIYYATVASLGARGALLPTLVSTAIWVSTASISAFLSEALRHQATNRRAAAVALAEARASQQAQDEVARLHEALELQLVPPAPIESPDLEVITRYLPSEGRLRLGGDFVDVMSLPRKDLALISGDVSGHGPAAAALGATLRATWQGLVMSGADRATIRATLDATMIRERHNEEAFATACLAWIDRVGDWDHLHFLNIAHRPPLLVATRSRHWRLLHRSPWEWAAKHAGSPSSSRSRPRGRSCSTPMGSSKVARRRTRTTASGRMVSCHDCAASALSTSRQWMRYLLTSSRPRAAR
jgi:Stage II sporulation protein E (SpoIIE)